jgi:hypothetical protein
MTDLKFLKNRPQDHNLLTLIRKHVGQVFAKAMQREPDDVEVAALDAPDEGTSVPLNSIGPGFVQRFPRVYVSPDDVIAEVVERDLRGLVEHPLVHLSTIAAQKKDNP